MYAKPKFTGYTDGRNEQGIYDSRRHRTAKKERNKLRAKKRWNKKRGTIAKPGCQPLSTMHPQHPARLYGWDSPESIDRDQRKWA